MSFSKGCYTGQEIIARTHHRGRIKRRMQAYSVAGSADASDSLHGERGRAGEVVRAASCSEGSELLAVVRVESAQDPLHLGSAEGPRLQPLPLPYEV